VQAAELGDETTTLLICPMSSDLQDVSHLRPLVDPSADNGLRLQSQIMADKVAPIRRDRVRRVLGALDTESVAQLDRALLVVLGLTR
jgi:mRNA interferase MazF